MAISRSHRPSRVAMPPIILPVVFALLVALLGYHVINHIDQITVRKVENSQDFYSGFVLTRCLESVPANTPLTAEVVKSCLQTSKSTPPAIEEAVLPRIEELKWLLTMIAFLGIFYTLAQVGTTWFSAEAYTKKAEDGLKKISDAFVDINATYPLFEHVAQLRASSFKALDEVFGAVSKAPDSSSGSTEALDKDDNLFRKLGVQFRQNLLSAESFASADLDLERTPDEHAELLRKLALFYRSKFAYEAGIAQGTVGDLERAEAYLLLAAKKKRDFTIKNDLGLVYFAIYVTIRRKIQGDRTDIPDNRDAKYYLEQAESAFRESLQIEPRQQRAHYNLAVIAAAYRGNFRKAIEELREALENGVWQRGYSPYMQSIILYNMGCYTSRVLQKSHGDSATQITPAEAKEVTSFLRQAGDLTSVRRNLIEQDFGEPNGDITGLLKIADETLKKELGQIKNMLLEKAQGLEIAGPKTMEENTSRLERFSRAMAEAFKTFKKAY